MAESPHVGFIGIGNMGWPMAANVAKAGLPLTVYDANPDASKRFADEHGCTAAGNLADLGAAADIVVTMLPTGPIVRAVMLDADGGGLAPHLAAGAIVIDMSSSEAIGNRELGAILAQKGITLIDAPVSGGVPRAEDGSLAIMIGGDDEDAIAKAEPVLSTMGGKLFRTGGLGNGHAMKALNNYVAAAGFTAAAEAMIMGQKFGLEPATMIDIINNSTGRNFNTELPIKDHVLTGTFATGFQLGLMAKDVKIAGDLGESIDIEAPLSRLVRDLWADALGALGPTQDFTAAIKRWEAINKKG
ncbi:MAG: NAD(P)-dependent oxidoreductase [Bauldia litoralis]